jgi:hypothetical protein
VPQSQGKEGSSNEKARTGKREREIEKRKEKKGKRSQRRAPEAD